jgi:transposase
MLTLPSSTLIVLARDRVDGRKGIDSLVALVRSQFGRDPLQGHLFVFLSRRGDRARVLFWDRNGYALTLKRLEKGTFKPIAFDATHAEIEYDELLALLGGLDLTTARRRPRWTPPPTTTRSVART